MWRVCGHGSKNGDEGFGIMTRITEKLDNLKKANKKAFIPFITAGDPTLSATEKYMMDLQNAGADIIELGVPFTDPLADGPTIQASHARALKRGVAPNDVLRMIKKMRKKIYIPIVLMLSMNLVQAPKTENFLQSCAGAGVDGLIVPDLAPEEAGKYLENARRLRIDTIFLAAPTSTEGRIRTIAKVSSGFVYLVSITGTTGARASLPSEISQSVLRVRGATQLPVCVGFGISNPSQAKEIAQHCDGVIVGSAIVERIEKKQSVASFAHSLARAVHTI